MRILTISNLYPPYFIGGYELGCRDVMQGLSQRGHQIRVLTSTWKIDAPVVEDDGPIQVHRQLCHFIGHERASLAQLRRMNPHNRQVLQHVVSEFKPDLIYIWNMAGLPLRLAFDAQKTGLPVCYYVSDLWLSHWQNGQSKEPNAGAKNGRDWKAFIRPVLQQLSGLQPHPRGLKFRCVQCTSAFIRDATMRRDLADASANYQVIHWGVETKKFHNAHIKRVNYNTESSRRRLIYAGQLAPHKGVATAIEVVQILKQSGYQLTLTIAGPSTYGNYDDELRELVQRLNLQEEVQFLGPVPREKLPELLASQEIFIFPAVWDEPFSIGLLEAMAAGLGVVSTTTGGSKEVVHHEENALVFSSGDASDCATQIKRLLDDKALLEKVSLNAQRTICENFTMVQMIQRIEESLQAAV